MSIELANESGLEVPTELVLSVAEFAISRMDVNPAAEMSIIFVNLDTMAYLHTKWMNLPGPTDVMSFPMDELTPGARRPDANDPSPATLGDIVLCPEFAYNQSKDAGHRFEHELAMLTVHGFLHLLGYDHAEPEEEQEMFGLTTVILDEWYADCHYRLNSAQLSQRDEELLRNTGFKDLSEH